LPVSPSRPASGQRVDRFFCPRGGTTLWAAGEADRRLVSRRAVSRDEPDRFTPAVHVRTGSARPRRGPTPGAPRFPENPRAAP